MSDWLGWLCMSLAGLQIIALFWSVYELRRKSVPELWGLDWLDILYGLERDFGVGFEKSDFEAIPIHSRSLLTAGQLWDLVVGKLQAKEQSIPNDGWDKFVTVLTNALNVKRNQVYHHSRLYEELGMEREFN